MNKKQNIEADNLNVRQLTNTKIVTISVENIDITVHIFFHQLYFFHNTVAYNLFVVKITPLLKFLPNYASQ